MKKTIYLHIGTPKTGTTTIQYFLTNNKELLGKNGVLYPYIQDKNYNKIFPNLFSIIKYINPDASFDVRNNKEIKEILTEEYVPLIEKSEATKIIFSSEHMVDVNPEVYDIFQNLGYDIKIILYLRRPADYVISCWGQGVKTFLNSTNNCMENFYRYKNVYYKRIIKYLKKFKPEDIILRPFEKEQWKNNDLIEDFLECLGLENSEEYIIQRESNITPSRNRTEIFRLFNSIGLDTPTLMKYKNELSKIPDNDKTKLVETLSDEEIEEITQFYMPVIEEICSLAGRKEKLFINEYPSCYKKERPVFENVVLSKEELSLYYQAVKERDEKKIDCS